MYDLFVQNVEIKNLNYFFQIIKIPLWKFHFLLSNVGKKTRKKNFQSNYPKNWNQVRNSQKFIATILNFLIDFYSTIQILYVNHHFLI